jgi:hypothetical protein
MQVQGRRGDGYMLLICRLYFLFRMMLYNERFYFVEKRRSAMS